MSTYKHLLLPTDLTKASEPAADKARALAQVTGAELIVLHVVDYVPPRYIAAELPEQLASETALTEHAREYLAEWIKKTHLDGCRQLVKAGSPKRLIVETARDLSIDLIVMSTHGERGLARIIGSTASGVMHDAPCDLLVVHLD